MLHRLLAFVALLTLLPNNIRAEPLHVAIDRWIDAGAQGHTPAALADDAEFVRRLYLDFTGAIPTAEVTRAFLADKATDKRAKLVEQLLTAPTYAPQMSAQFHLMFMERLGDHAEWQKYLLESFTANKPWDQMSREILRGRAESEPTKGAVFFFAKRLENYGQNPVDYPALTRDVGRLFLGVDLRCAECHDHLFINDYKQADYKGLAAFFQNISLLDAKLPSITEKPTVQKLAFSSVFKKEPKEIGPRVPGLKELAIPELKKGDEYVTKPDPKTNIAGVLKFSPLAELAQQLPHADNPAFARNAVNRLWFMLLGRGIVHPLDLHHSANPPSHPELLELLAKEFVSHKFDIKYILREIALSRAYQRSSQLADVAKPPPADRFMVAIEKRIPAESLMRNLLIATGHPLTPDAALQAKFVKAFANPTREPEEEFLPSLKGVLFMLNDAKLLDYFQPKAGNLVERTLKLASPEAMAQELYMSVLSRSADADEVAMFTAHLQSFGDSKAKAVGQYAWALVASTEFVVNH